MASPELERAAERWLSRAGFPLDAAPHPVRLAEALLGPEAVRFAAVGHQPPGLAALIEARGRNYILLRRGTNRAAGRWGVFHELGHWVAEREGWDARNEFLADAIGALLRTPMTLARRAVSVHGPNWTQLSLALEISESASLLRYGEVTNEPVAVLSRTVRSRGAEYPWPKRDELKKLVRQELPGLRKARLDGRYWGFRVA